MEAKVITDSAADLVLTTGRTLYNCNNIRLIPIHIHFDEGDDFLEQKTINIPEFYELLKLTKKQPYTSPPTDEEILKIYEEEGKKHDILFSFHLSKGLSESYNNAMHAKKRYLVSAGNPAKVHVIHTGMASIPMGLQVLKSLELIQEGYSDTEILKRVYRWKENNLSVLFSVKNLDHLYETKRISRAQYMLANIAKKKPIMGFSKGEVIVVDKVSGFNNALQSMVNKIVERLGTNNKNEKKITLSFVSSQVTKELENFHKNIRNKHLDVNIGPIFEMGPTIVTNSGVGSVGIVGTTELEISKFLCK